MKKESTEVTSPMTDRHPHQAARATVRNSFTPLLQIVLCAIFLLFADMARASQPPIEIWLSERVGRWGDYVFHALGGKKTHPTPKGTFTVKSKYHDYYSRKYKAPMPRSVFFTSQCAIHVGSLTQKSHGCIHVDWETAEMIYEYAKPGKTKVIVYP